MADCHLMQWTNPDTGKCEHPAHDAPEVCQYSAAHKIRGEYVPAVTVIDCGPVGIVPACQACADFYRKMS